MPTKVYLLLDLIDGYKAHMACTLRTMPGITIVDVLEGSPDLMTVIEARGRQEAARYLMKVLDLIDGLARDIRVMPVEEAVGSQAVTGAKQKPVKMETEVSWNNIPVRGEIWQG